MALFSLTDIKFEKSQDRTSKNPNSYLKYQSNVLKYPEDLGDVDKGHYMLIHINVSELTNQTNYCYAPQASNPLSSNYSFDAGVQNIGNLINNIPSSGGKGFVDFITKGYNNVVAATPNAVKQSLEVVGDVAGGASEEIRKLNLAGLEFQNFARRTKRITDTIALYMPNTLSFTQAQTYDEVGRNDLLTGGIAAALASKGSINDPKQLGRNLSPFLFQALQDKIGSITQSPGTIRTIFANIFGAVNPRLEILYSRPQFRDFSFEFMFYARSEKEALEVQRIIQKLKYHQAPEIKKGTAGQFLVPPSDFNIDFYYNGAINDNIPKIKGPCILTSIDTDYAPNGFHAYESGNDLVPKLGGTGMPIGIRMRLSFREIEFMTKDAYNQESNDI